MSTKIDSRLSEVETTLKFRLLDVSCISELKEFTQNYLPYSDFNVLSLLSWNADASNSYTFVLENLIIKMKDYLSEKDIYLFMGSDHLDEVLPFLISQYGSLCCVPEDVLSSFPNIHDIFEISPDRDNFDYILSLENMVSLRGKKYKNLRKQVNNFKTQIPDYSVKELHLDNAKEVQEVLDLTVLWAKQKNFEKKKTEEDLLITKNFLKYAKHFECVLLGVYDKESLVGFTFNECLSDGWVMGHFGKAENSIKGCSVFLEHITAEYLLSRGFKSINHQQDAGLLGLREFKMGYRPVRFLKKYTISKK